MKTSKLLSAVAGAVLALGAVTSQALEIGFVPQNQNPAVGGTANVDIVLSGLTALDQVVSGYDIDVTFSGSPTVQFLSGSYGLGLGDPNDPGQTFSGLPIAAVGGVIDLFQLSLLTDAELDALQGDSLVLATLQFTAATDIFSSLSITFDPNSITGTEGVGGAAPVATVLNPTTTGAQITFGNPTVAVPLPATPLLLLAGLVGFAGVRRLRG